MDAADWSGNDGFKKQNQELPLMVQWVKISNSPNAEGGGAKSLVGELRSYILTVKKPKQIN